MKLFGKGGKLNIIDLLVILVLLAAVVLVGYKFLFDGGLASDKNTVKEVSDEPNLRFTVLCEDVPEALAEQVIASFGKEAAQVNGQTVEMTQLYYSNVLEDGKFVEWYTVERGDRVDLYLTIEAVADGFDTGVYSVGWQEIRIAKEFVCKTLYMEIAGVVYSMEPLK